MLFYIFSLDLNNFTLILPNGQQCNEDNEHPLYYQVKATINCDSTVTDDVVIDDVSNFDTCNPTITLRSNALCEGVPASTWIELTQVKPEIWGFILIIVGLFILLFGNKYRVAFGVIMMGTISGIGLVILVSPFVKFPTSCKASNH